MRTTDDKKENSMRIRLNKDMAAWVSKESRSKGISASQLIRDLIAEKMK